MTNHCFLKLLNGLSGTRRIAEGGSIFRSWISLAAAFLVVSLGGCAARVPRFAYVTNADFFEDSVSIYTVNAATGQLRANGYVLAGDTPMSVAVDPLNRFAYVVNFWSNDISEYQINSSNGRLTEIAGSPLPMGAGFQPISVTVDPTGRFVYIANNFPGFQEGISAYAINANTGSLTEITGSPFNTGGGQSSSVTVEPTGHFAYVANYLTNNVSAFAINNTTGALTPVSGSPFAAGTSPTSVVVEPLGQYVYVVNEFSNNISAYTINSTTGALTPVPGSPFAAGNFPGYMAIDSKGQFAYVTNTGSNLGFTNAILGYRINRSTGALAPLSGSPFPAKFPGAIRVDLSGQFVYVANASESNDVGTYRIDPATGNLQLLSTIRTRDYPSSIALSSGSAPVKYTPTFAYVPNSLDNSISAFSINATTGGLTPVPGSPFSTPNKPFGMAVDSRSRFAYLAGFAGNALPETVLGFAIDATSGALTPIPGSPFPSPGQFETGTQVVDPSDRFLYVLNESNIFGNPGTIPAFKIDTSAGVLTQIFPSNPVSSVSNPIFAAIDPTGRFLYVGGFFGIGGNCCLSAYSIYTITGYPYSIPALQLSFSTLIRSLVVHPTGKFVYVGMVNDTLPAQPPHIRVYDVDSVTGAWTEIASSPFVVPAQSATGMAIDPWGKFAYVATIDNSNSQSTDKVFAYAIDSTTGGLTLIPGSPFILQPALNFIGQAGQQPLSVDPSGRFLFLLDILSMSLGPARLFVSSIDPNTGALTQVGPPITVGSLSSTITTTGRIQ